jgi:hypothetical protein
VPRVEPNQQVLEARIAQLPQLLETRLRLGPGLRLDALTDLAQPPLDIVLRHPQANAEDLRRRLQRFLLALLRGGDAFRVEDGRRVQR